MKERSYILKTLRAMLFYIQCYIYLPTLCTVYFTDRRVSVLTEPSSVCSAYIFDSVMTNLCTIYTADTVMNNAHILTTMIVRT